MQLTGYELGAVDKEEPTLSVKALRSANVILLVKKIFKDFNNQVFGAFNKL